MQEINLLKNRENMIENEMELENAPAENSAIDFFEEIDIEDPNDENFEKEEHESDNDQSELTKKERVIHAMAHGAWIKLTKENFSKYQVRRFYDKSITSEGWISFVKRYIDKTDSSRLQLQIYYNYLKSNLYRLKGINPYGEDDDDFWELFKRYDKFLLETMRRNKMTPKKIWASDNIFCIDFLPQLFTPQNYPFDKSITDMFLYYHLNTTNDELEDKTLESIARRIPRIYISIPAILKNIVIDINVRGTVCQIINTVVKKIDATWEWKRLFRFRGSSRIWSEIQILPKENFIEKYTCCDDLK